jgi:hypothetical protein
MSDAAKPAVEPPAAPPPAPEPPAAPKHIPARSAAAKKEPPERVYLVSYPKIAFLYPTFLMALGSAVYLTIDPAHSVIVTALFLGVLCINLVVISFDFPRTTSLTLFFFAAAIVMGGYLLSVLKPDVLPFLGNIFGTLQPQANATFYYVFVGIMVILYLFMFGSVQFDYWEVRPNELLHHHGMLSDLKRYSAPDLRVDKEINDVFEYLLLRSGRLILHPSGEKRSIILENVLFITQKEESLTRMLGALQVQVRKAGDE